MLVHGGALAGLRRSDLKRLRWRDVDFEEGTLTVREGKAKRVDVLPLHPQLVKVLQSRQTERKALPAAKVFPQAVATRTQQRDFLRAGLAREVPIIGDDGNRRRKK